MDQLITFYFSLGLQQLEIRACLASNHGIHLSSRTLKRKLNALNLFRKKNFSDVYQVAAFIENEVQSHGKLHGYRWMHLKCLQNNLIVTQETIRLLLHIIDPVGVDFRSRRRLRRRQYKNKGPNFLWHMDCYDKLKPYGICISGCIDGFSRKIIWLRAGSNSNDPKIICNYFYESIKLLGGCPRTIRADLGTENGNVRELQNYLREHYSNGNVEGTLPPFLYGTSPTNQRIEAWWAILRKHFSQFWINLFQTLKEEGQFSGSFLDKSLIQFCFLEVIQEELDVFVREWDTHFISSSRNSISPRGRPFIMFMSPEIYGTRDYLTEIPEENIEECAEVIMYESSGYFCDPDVHNLSVIIMEENNFNMPQNSHEGVDLYLNLRSNILDLL